MLEGLVANLLNRFLGMYVKNFDPKQLNIGIWNGDVKLRNLALRREALDQLHLPVNVIEGYLGELTMSIPWTNLRGKPVKITIEDVFVLAAPKENSGLDEEEEKTRAFDVKMKKLESAEMLKQQSVDGLSDEEQQQNQSFAASVTTAIVDNIQVSIKSIHIRYEDTLATPGHPFALGFTLEEFSAISTDSGWQPSYIQSTSDTANKLATLSSLAIYWNTDATLISNGANDSGDGDNPATEHIIARFRNAMQDESNQYMLKPVNGQAKIEIDKKGKTEAPRIKARLFFEELGFVIDDEQYRDALMMVELFHYFIRHQEYKKLQPAESPKENPRAWLKFAFTAVHSRIRERNRRWTWAYFQERRDDRLQYIELFKKRKKDEKLTPEENDSLNALEARLTYEDLRFWRSLARNQLRKENVGVKKAPKKQSWGEWAFGTKSADSQDAMTAEQRQELYAAIDWDEKKAIAESVDLPRETVKLQVESTLKSGSFTLRRKPHDDPTEIMSIVFQNFRAKAIQRPDSFLAEISLGSMYINDGTTPDSRYPQIVSFKEAIHSDSPDIWPSADGSNVNDDLFLLTFEHNPLDESADNALTMKIKSIEIIYNPRFIVDVMYFFKPPERHMESIGVLMESAGATVEGIRQQTRAGLEFALEEHKTINANLDIQAPLIIIPESIAEEDTLCLILDAGHVSVQSDLVAKETIRDIHAKQSQEYTDEDFRQLEGLMYDKFIVRLEDTQALMGPGIAKTKAQLTSTEDPDHYHIIERINMDFLLENLIIPKATNLTKTRISGHLPILHASLSDEKYKGLMRLIDIAIPSLDDKESAEASSSPTKAGAPLRSATSRHDDLDVEETGEHSVKMSQKPSSVNLSQRQFEFKFTVDRLQGSLYRASDQSADDQLLVEVVAEHFELEFYVQAFDMVADVSLQRVTVDDHIESDPSSEFRKIIYSDAGDQNRSLVNVKFIRVNPKSPQFSTKYESIATHLDVSVSTFNLVVTRKTLLTLLDFILMTFANPEDSTRKIEPKKGQDTAPIQDSNNKIRIKADLQKIALILNNDGIRLATLSLHSADVGIFLHGPTMDITARLGNLSLVDDVNQGADESSPVRQLLSIDENNLADFRYQTFDHEAESWPGYNSRVYLRSGSVKIQFIEEPFRKIISFLVKFGQMQAIYNAARDAATNASQSTETRAMMQFDVVIKTPIITFPRTVSADTLEDIMTAHLGEFYVNNTFSELDNAPRTNNICLGLRNVRLTTSFHYGAEFEELEMIHKLDLDFKIDMPDPIQGSAPLPTEIQGQMSPVNLCVSQPQLQFLLELSGSVPNAFSTEPVQIEDAALSHVLKPKSSTPVSKDISQQSNNTTVSDQHSADSVKTTMKLTFVAPTMSLELILAATGKPVGDTAAASLSQFSLNDTKFGLDMKSDGSLESELLVQSLTIRDSRQVDGNKFRKIMSLMNNDVKQQFMASISISGGAERHMVVMLTLDCPRVIMAIDYLLAINAFIAAAFTSPAVAIDAALEDDDDSDEDSADLEDSKPAESDSSTTSTMSVRINIVDAQAILIANPSLSSSEAIVLGTKSILMSQQNAMTLQMTKISMYLCRMDNLENSRLRILDDFSLTMSMENRSHKQSPLTSIAIDVEPLVLRLSLRDILLALQIVNKASEMSSSMANPPPLENSKAKTTEFSDKRLSIAKSTTRKRTSVVNPDTSSSSTPKVLKREELNASVDGLRIILIGDLHELPLLDWTVHKFHVDVRDWSGAMTGDTNLEMALNVYNFSKSAWEPLIEPWQLGFHLSQRQKPDCLAVELYSHKMLELTVTSATIALASRSLEFLSTDEDMLSKPRGRDAPYRIRNYTGFVLDVWSSSEKGAAAKLADGEEASWRFEDATTMREHLTPEGQSGVVGIKLEGSGFESIERIAVNREGETLYNLRPRQDKVLHRLLVEVKLDTDNVKYITFRSPLVVQNMTQIPVEVGVYNPEEGHLLKIERIAPGEERPAPVGAAFIHSLVIRPDKGFGYSWSKQRLFWKELLKRPTRMLTCQGETDGSPPFYFHLNASYDKKDPITGVYPHMKIRIYAPIEIQNLLPYDFKYRIYDKTSKKDWTNFLRKGGVSPVHSVELSHLLLLSIDMQETPFKPSDFAVINTGAQEDFRREKRLVLKDSEGSPLKLKLHYFSIPDSGGAFKISVYSPYVVLNKTGSDMQVAQSKTMFTSAKVAAGQNLVAESDSMQKALPYMFSYATDERKNRASVKLGNSQWSKPQSFDAIGSTFEVVLPCSSSKQEMHVGVSVAEAEGKYNLSKIVTIAPRYIIKNKIDEELCIKEPGSNIIMELKQSELRPLLSLQPSQDKQLCLCWKAGESHWSSPFNISNVGTVHVKLSKAGQRQQLVRVEVILEAATLFVHVSVETNHWPFSMRNESDTEFMFYQVNPKLREDEDDHGSSWKPIRYRLPPKSIMPYAWDYPASRNKELILVAHGKERRIKLAEIGNLVPWKIPSHAQKSGKIIDLNISADGPTQKLVLGNYRPAKSLYRQKTGMSQSSPNVSSFEVKELDSDVTFKAQLRLAGIGVSLINAQIKELLYLTLRDIELKYTDSLLYQKLNSTIKWIQIDNQLYGGIFPMLLYPSVVPKTGKEMDAHPIFSTGITRVKDDSYGVLYIKYFTVLVQQITVELDEDFIFAMLDFMKIPGASWTDHPDDRLCEEELSIPEPKKDQEGQDVYFELFHLQPMQLDLSFVRTERINAEDTTDSSNPFMFIVNVMTMSVGNVNDAPLRLNALMLENARTSVSALMASVQNHYTQECIRQIHIILGSADFLGNPVGLFNNVSSGVADIFYEPYQGLVMTDRPQELGIGIAKGASSFVKKSVFGFSDSMAKITGSMSKGLAAATLDKEYQDQRRMSKSRNRPKHALYGVTSGGNAFATSLASGIGGLARHPIAGAEKEGFEGFMKGVGKGVLGLATKPAIGAFDLASNISEGVRNTTTVFDGEGLDRVRLTRFTGLDGIVRPYAQREALGQFWLKTLDDGKFFGEDYIAHLELPGKDMLVMLTYNRIMLVKLKKLRMEWDIKLNDIQTISKERTGMSITLKGGTNGPFVPVADESSRNWLYKQIAVAVNAFNDKYDAKA